MVPRRIVDDSSDESDVEPARPAAAAKTEARSTLKNAVARTRMHRQRESKPQKEIKAPAPIKVAFLSPDENDQENHRENNWEENGRQSSSPALASARS